MKRSRFTETEIVGILKESDAGLKVGEICRKHRISAATYGLRDMVKRTSGGGGKPSRT